MHVQPTFNSVEQQYTDELVGDPGPGLARQATEFVQSQFYTRSFDEMMGQPTAQQQIIAGGLAPVAPPGFVGPPGPAGPQGPAGSGGGAGPQGPTGPGGGTGGTGTQGPVGPAGPQGQSGSSGGPASGGAGASASGRSGGPTNRYSAKKPQSRELDVNMVSPTDQGGGAGGAAAIAVQAVQPQVVTEAQQTGINEVRLQAELYKLQMDQRLHQQQQDFAQFM